MISNKRSGDEPTIPASDKGFKPFDDLLNSICQMHERWNNRLELENLDIAKTYIEGKLGVLVRFDRSRGNRTRLPNLDANGQRRDVEIARRNDYRAPRSREKHMLVYNVQFVQGIDQVSTTTLEHFEGLEKIRQIANGCFYSITRGFIIDPIVTDWKGGVSVLSAPVKSPQFPVRVVKGGSQVMYRVPDNECEGEWHKLAEINVNNGFPAFRIFADGKSVRVILNEGSERSFQIGDVLLGPFNL